MKTLARAADRREADRRRRSTTRFRRSTPRRRSSSACPTRCRIAAASGAGIATRSKSRSSRSRSAAPAARQGRAWATAAAMRHYRAADRRRRRRRRLLRAAKGAVGAFIGEAGAAPIRHGCAPIWNRRSARRRAIRRSTTTPISRPGSPISIRWIAWTRERQGEKEGRAAAEPIEPTYPAPLGSVAEARRVLARHDARHRRPGARYHAALAGLQEDDEPPPPPCMGDQCRCRRSVRPGHLREIVVARADRATACRSCWRCRGTSSATRSCATWPQPGSRRGSIAGARPTTPTRPARDVPRLERVAAISPRWATSSSTPAEQRDEDVCEFFDICGYQRQRQARPDVWLIPHELLFHQRPHSSGPAVLGIDESVLGRRAARHGNADP